MTYCTDCGTPRQPGSRFCTGCGKQVSAAVPTPMVAPASGSGTTATAIRRYELDVMSYPPPPTSVPWSEAPAPIRGGEQGWGTDPPTSSRSRGRLVAGLTTLALFLGAGVVAWVTLTDFPAPPPSSPAPPLNQPQVETSISQATAPPARINSEDAVLNQLTRQILLDRAQVQSELAENWVPQLSSKRPGLVVDSVSLGYIQILDDHLVWRSTHNALLVRSGDWSSFQAGDFYVTVAPVPFSTAAEANAWCDRQAIDSENCFAKRLSTSVGPEGSTVSR